MSIRVTVWNENRSKTSMDKMHEVYPDGIHGALADTFKKAGFEVKIALLDDAENGLSEDVLNNTDVLVFWAHLAHNEVTDEVTERICRHVNRGMGFIPLHSAHFAKPFKKLLGTSCTLDWRESDDRQLIWCIHPGHPIAEGIKGYIDLEKEETYSEFFDIPKPDELVFVSWFSGGEIFRSGCCFYRGNGRIFYFQPGHETLPTYYNPEIQKVLINAVKWACPQNMEKEERICHHITPTISRMD